MRLLCRLRAEARGPGRWNWMLTYLLVDLGVVAIPFALSFHRPLRFYRNWYALWPAILTTAGLFIAWDILFARWGVWGFDARYHIGLYCLGLPLEEWLFFICIPYACLFVYQYVRERVERDRLSSWTTAVTWALAASLAGIALWHSDRIYTTVTCGATALFLLQHLRRCGSTYLNWFYPTCAILLVPFLLVDGVLTGSFTEGKPVWYDDSENLAVRVFTIPVEDSVYGLLLMLVNVTLYETIKARRTAGTRSGQIQPKGPLGGRAS